MQSVSCMNSIRTEQKKPGRMVLRDRKLELESNQRGGPMKSHGFSPRRAAIRAVSVF